MDKTTLISEIIGMELDMFLTVSTASPAPCQEDPEGFRTFRSAQFQAWSMDTLQNYYRDLEQAKGEGKNLMTLKYARMDNLIPELHENQQVRFLLSEIVSINLEWQREILAKYPSLIYQGRPLDDGREVAGTTSFKRYLKSELETYSLPTLTSLFRDIMDRKATGDNMTEEIYLNLVTQLGYDSLEDAENTLKQERVKEND